MNDRIKSLENIMLCDNIMVTLYNKVSKVNSFKVKSLTSFTHPQVFSNLYEFLSSAEHKRRYFEESCSK